MSKQLLQRYINDELIMEIKNLELDIIGFDENHFTGPTSTITSSFIFLIAFVHLIHVTAGLLVLLFVIYRNIKRKYSINNILGFELASIFWHFVDILWIYLFLFLVFFR